MADEPTIAFVFYSHQWASVIHPITKLELVDWVAASNTNFFFDTEGTAFVLLLKKSVWAGLDAPLQQRFKLISRRVREEMDGPFTEEQRHAYETNDPFDIFEKPEPQPEPMPEEDTPKGEQ